MNSYKYSQRLALHGMSNLLMNEINVL